MDGDPTLRDELVDGGGEAATPVAGSRLFVGRPQPGAGATPEGHIVQSLDQEIQRRLEVERSARALAEAGQAETSLLYQLTEEVHRAERLEDVYPPALDAIIAGLRVGRASILLADRDGVMRFEASRGLSDEYRARVEGHSPWAPDTHDPEPVLVADVERDISLAGFLDLFRREGIRALGFVPLTHRRRLLGKVVIYSDEPRIFSARDLEIARAIAAQIGQAVARQQLFDAERGARRDAELGGERLRLLQGVTASLSHAATVSDVAQVIVTQGAAATRAATGGLWLIDEPRTCVDLVYSVGYADEDRQGFARIPLTSTTELPLLEALRTGLPVWVPSKQVLAIRYPALTALPTLRDDQAIVCFPIVTSGRCAGALAFTFAAPAEMDEAAQDFLLTVAHQGELALERAQLFERERRAVLARDDLMGVVSHDLRNLLGLMTMNAAAIVKNIPESAGETARKYADAIKRTSGRMERLVRDLLDFGSIESGRIALETQPEDVDQFLPQALEDLRPLAVSQSIRLQVEPPGCPVYVRCDRQRVFQVLSNLVGNAIKFTPSGGSIVVRAKPEGKTALFAVRDTGPGVDPAHLPKIFDRYYQGNAREPGGVGLGLFIARGIVEAHGGRIWAENPPDGGSQFFFTLPLLES